MKTIIIASIYCFICLHAYGGDKVDPNPSFQKLIAGATRVVIRDGDASERAALKHKVYFEVKDAAEIKLLAKNMVFIRGAWRNDCDCRGYPGMDWYVGDKLVAITAIKHGYGIIRNRTIARFTKESKIWMTKWLLEHGIKKEQLR
ncbi:hypothetical protein N9Z92_02770 [Akkermansiaceae bacterium]|nr:hypothetical protein [Akkermansiaceae bacterium]MDB4572808.1 hypothetical protein [Akkermansiaceae bacterium]